MIPLLAMFLIKVKQTTKKSVFDTWTIYYNRLIIASLKRPYFVIFTVLTLFFISLWGFRFIPTMFMPPSDRDLVFVEINLPLGSRIETTEQNIAVVEQFIRDSLLVHDQRKKGIKNWSSFIGIGPNAYDKGYRPGEQSSGYAHMLINTTSYEANALVMHKLEHFCFNTLHDAQVSVRQLGTGGAAVPIEIRLFGDDPDQLFALSGDIKKQLNRMSGTKNVDDDWGPKIKKFFIKIHQSKAEPFRADK